MFFFLSASRSPNTPPPLLCGRFGVSQLACVSECGMKERRKYDEKNQKGEEKLGRS